MEINNSPLACAKVLGATVITEFVSAWVTRSSTQGSGFFIIWSSW